MCAGIQRATRSLNTSNVRAPSPGGGGASHGAASTLSRAPESALGPALLDRRPPDLDVLQRALATQVGTYPASAILSQSPS